jgi:hypothetical protein
MTGLTEAERYEHGRTAEEFPARQLVYSLTNVEAIVTARTNELRCQLAATKIKLHAAREALAACRECAAKRAGR